jgi:hypothetical protein
VVNSNEGKKLTNHRASGSDAATNIQPKREMTLEECMEYIQQDECIEVTPVNIRMAKVILGRKRKSEAAEAHERRSRIITLTSTTDRCGVFKKSLVTWRYQAFFVSVHAAEPALYRVFMQSVLSVVGIAAFSHQFAVESKMPTLIMTNNNLPTLSSVKPGTKVLFANFPADGHFNPLTGLAFHLKEKGCDVRWYTSERYREKVERLGIQFFPLKKATDFFTSQAGIDSAERARCKSTISKLNFDLTHAFVLRGAEYYEDIREIHELFPFDVWLRTSALPAFRLLPKS